MNQCYLIKANGFERCVIAKDMEEAISIFKTTLAKNGIKVDFKCASWVGTVLEAQ